MSRVVVGLFDHSEEAESAVRELTANGFARESLSIVAHDRREDHAAEIEKDSQAADAAATGATGGAVLGGIGGLVLGLGALAIPGIGPLIAAGPLVGALSGAAVGAGVGGIAGALTGMGVPEEEAHFYAEGVRSGATLVTVDAARDGDWTAVDILRRHGARDIEQRRKEWNEPTYTQSAGERDREPAVASSATLERPAALSQAPMIEDDSSWEDDCRRHYESNREASSRSYDELRPAYEYGYHVASDPRFVEGSWEATESNVRQDWSTRGHGAWEEVKEAVRCGWSCGRKHGDASHVEGFSGIRGMHGPADTTEEVVTGDQFDERADRRI